MPRQEQIFADTIVAMKRATARQEDASDSDDSIRRSTNRGNKLKRKAKFMRPERLDTTDELRKRRIIYNTYPRTILSHNPPGVDADGDVIERIDEEESDGDLTPAEDDPFAEIQLQDLLMPLTSAAGLKHHPSLSAPYNSRAIEQMIRNVQDMLYREQEALWKLKLLASEIRGDQTWMPCGMFETENDVYTLAKFPPTASTAPSAAMSIPPSVAGAEVNGAPRSTTEPNWETMASVRLMTDIEAASLDGMVVDAPHDAYEAPELSMPDSVSINGSAPVALESEQPTTAVVSDERDASTEATHPVVGKQESDVNNKDTDTAMEDLLSLTVNGTTTESQPPEATVQETADTTEEAQRQQDQPSSDHIEAPTDTTDTKMEDVHGDNIPDLDSIPLPIHRMTTRNQARAAEPPSPPLSQSSPSSPPLSPIHPFFLVPLSAHPDNSIGLPHDQADETRRLLIAYVQRQEDVVRGVNALYTGLLKAKKMKEEVAEWCNAEGHVGELSDGEDWVDEEYWGLMEGELKKGEEVEEEEEEKRGKKTRNRRQVA